MDEQKNEHVQDDDLERYGVWVKAGPEEVVEAEEDFAFADLPGDEIESSGGETAESDEIDDFSDELDDLSLDDLDESGGEEAGEQESGISSETADSDMEDLDLDDDFSLDSNESELTVDTAEEEPGAASEEDDMVSLDDLDIEVPEEDPDPFDGLDADEGETPEETPAAAEASPESAGAEESAAVPADVSGTAGGEESEEEDFDLGDLDEDLGDDFESLDLDAADPASEAAEEEKGDFEESIPGTDDELQDISLDDINVSSDSSNVPELEADTEESAGEQPETPEEHSFTPEETGIEIDAEQPGNRISAEEEQFFEESEEEQPGGSAGDAELQKESDRAIPAHMESHEREAFERIQSELSDIKKELAELKAALRAGAAPSGGPQPSAPEEPAEDAAGQPPDDETVGAGESEASGGLEPGPGFFEEEEEDETIALTGDELDNILNTAEFTEQAGEAEELEDDFLVESDQGSRPAADETAGEPAETAETEETGDESESEDRSVESIEMEPAEHGPVVFQGDDSAVDELADMDIDTELADIERLDDTQTEASPAEQDEVDIDLDTIGEESDEQPVDEQIDSGTPDLGDLDIDEADREDFHEGEQPAESAEKQVSEIESGEEDFDQFAAAVEEDIAGGEPGADEGIELDEEFDEPEPAERGGEAAAAEEPADEEELEIDLDDIDSLDVDLGEEELEGETEPEAEESGEGLEAEMPSFEEPSTEESAATGEEAESAGEAAVEEPAGRQEPPVAGAPKAPSVPPGSSISDLPEDLKQEIRSVLSYMDQLLEALPDDKIEEFAQSEHFEVYRRLFEELGLDT